MAESFDYIIVGAGSAGCVLADRLSADGRSSVLLVEAGTREWIPLYRLPLLAGRMYRFPINNWFYNSSPQAGMQNRAIFLPRGKMVGGSFIFNGMQYVRGHATDYDHWAQLGNRGWSYSDVLPYFKKSEAFYGGGSEFHGVDGPLPVTKQPENNPLSQAFVEACREAGHPRNDDFNGATQDGFGFFDFNIRDGRRVTTAQSHLYPALRRPNLSLMSSALTDRIVFADGAARGVEVLRAGRRQTITARREVILSAGAINTPQILLRSGIGPGDHLRAFGIDVRADVPGVGKNFQDHINFGIGYKAREPVSIVGSLRLDRLVGEMLRGILLRKGPVARSVLEAGGFFRSRPGLDAPDVQVVFTPIFGPAARVWMPWAQTLDDHSFGAVVWPIRPASRGEVTLGSADPNAAPNIDPRFLSAPVDVETTLVGLRELRRILNQPALARYRGEELKPGREVEDDTAWIDYIRGSGGSGHHACGTAKMGSDPLAVVDDQLKLRAMAGVRIADTSIMPTMASGNTNAPVIMIAEKAADMILAARH